MENSLKQLVQRLLELNRSIKIALASALLLLLLLLIFPFQTVIVPAWTLQIVDDANQPIGAIKVTQHWQHYLLESEGHEEQKLTDLDGRVDFSERGLRASLLGRLFARLYKLGKKGTAARTDAYASLVVWGSKNHQITTHVYDSQQPPASRLVVVRLP